MAIRSHALTSPRIRGLLVAAEAEFEQHGYAGARIDRIAARANMAKSHVYYHFAGKRQIFDDLVAMRVAEILAGKEELFADVGTDIGPQAIGALIRRAVTELLAPRAAFLRVVLLESIGTGMDGDGGEALLFSVLRPVLDDTADRFEALGVPLDREAVMSDAFHFGLMPAIVHIALGPKLAEVLGVTPERCDELFLARLVQLQQLNLSQAVGKEAGA